MDEMPGYILHLTAAEIFLQSLERKGIQPIWTELEKSDFLAGNLMPDTVKEKSLSHFRSRETTGDIVQYPILPEFLTKYRKLLRDKSCLGYYFHLYVDYRFFSEFLETIVRFCDCEGKEEKLKKCICTAKILKNQISVTPQEFFSEEYYYGDYTKMNTWLANRYGLSCAFPRIPDNPGIEEVEYADLDRICEELKTYMKVPPEAVSKLKVFDLQRLIGFMEYIADYEEFRKYLPENAADTIKGGILHGKSGIGSFKEPPQCAQI